MAEPLTQPVVAPAPPPPAVVANAQTVAGTVPPDPTRQVIRPGTAIYRAPDATLQPLRTTTEMLRVKVLAHQDGWYRVEFKDPDGAPASASSATNGWHSSVVVAAVLLLALAAGPQAPSFQASVVGVADGDTITVLRDRQQIRIRLDGIDCPEGGQAFSNRAKQLTSALTFGRR